MMQFTAKKRRGVERMQFQNPQKGRQLDHARNPK